MLFNTFYVLKCCYSFLQQTTLHAYMENYQQNCYENSQHIQHNSMKDSFVL